MKKKVVVFCDKYLGFTLLSSGGVLEDLIDAFDLTIITTTSAEDSIRNVTGGKCTILTYDDKGVTGRNHLSGMISDILSMTYARGPNGRQNLTGPLHRKAHMKLAQNKSLPIKIQKAVVAAISKIAENSNMSRKVLQRLFFLSVPKEKMKSVLAGIGPSLCIATTAGLGQDGVFFAAARSLHVPCLALIQSWDRTASKGYPAVHPEHCIVWNEAMFYEAQHFLEMPEDRIYVEGAPPWDKYLSGSPVLSAEEKSAFFQKWKLDEKKRLVFVALNGPATHDENLQMIRDICSASLRGELDGIQIMFRSHPAYLIDAQGTQSIVEVFEDCKNPDMHLMHPIVIDAHVRNHIVTEEDRQFMHDMFRACDLTVSIMSTWMIESSIFDKPNICIEYGRYTTSLYDFDLSEYQAEHIARIFSYEAVYRVRSTPALISGIRDVLNNIEERRQQRDVLASTETVPNMDTARNAVKNRIIKIAF